MTASSISLPATRTDREYTIPLMEMTAMSVVPPPMSTTMMPEDAPVVRLLNEVGEHLFGHLEIGDHAVLHWLNGHYVARRAPEHVLGFLPDSHDLATVLIDGHNGRLVHHDAFAFCVDQCVGRAQVYRKVGRKQANDRAKAVSVLVHGPLSSGHLPRFADAAYRSASGWPLCVCLAVCLATELQFPHG